MPPAALRRRPLPLFIASSKITSSVGADSVSARRFPTNGYLLYTAGPGMPGPYRLDKLKKLSAGEGSPAGSFACIPSKFLL